MRVVLAKATCCKYCMSSIGTVADNELEDLQRKAAKLGGNVALLTPQRTTKGGYFGLQDYKTADVYKCEGR